MSRNIRVRSVLLRVDQLVSHPHNVRNGLGDDAGIEELARSIKEHGILQPIVVAPTVREDRFLILAGHRRAAAACLAGLLEVPATIRTGTEGDADEHLVVMLVENCQRTNLTPVEKAQALGALRNRGLSQAEISRRTGIAQSEISSNLMLLDLDEESLRLVEERQITIAAAQDAIRDARKRVRRATNSPNRGRPVVVEPPHFAADHPLALHARFRCDHTTRPKLHQIACGQCWEAAIRADALGQEHPRPAIDEMAVQRAVNGDRPAQLAIVDRFETIRRLAARGMSDEEIGRTLRITARQVTRDRQAIGAESRWSA